MFVTHLRRISHISQVVNSANCNVSYARTCNVLQKKRTTSLCDGKQIHIRHCSMTFFGVNQSSNSVTSGHIPANHSSADGFKKKAALLAYQPVRFAGHSHWQNIRHTKGASDAQRQKDNIRIRQKIRLAIRMGGSADPKLNRDLARAIEDGKACNLPMAAMTDTIKKATESKDEGSEVVYEAMNVLTNFFLMIECYTDRPRHIRNHLQGILKRNGGKMLEPGRAASMFDQKGVIYVLATEEYALDLDQATEQAIEAGAEEVLEGLDSNDNPCLRFFCGPKELHQVKTALENLQVPISDARFEFIPHTFMKIKPDQAELAQKMIAAVEVYEDVVRVYDNVEIDETKS